MGGQVQRQHARATSSARSATCTTSSTKPQPPTCPGCSRSTAAPAASSRATDRELLPRPPLRRLDVGCPASTGGRRISRGAAPAQVFHSTFASLRQLGKPVMLSEVGTSSVGSSSRRGSGRRCQIILRSVSAVSSARVVRRPTRPARRLPAARTQCATDFDAAAAASPALRTPLRFSRLSSEGGGEFSAARGCASPPPCPGRTRPGPRGGASCESVFPHVAHPARLVATLRGRCRLGDPDRLRADALSGACRRRRRSARRTATRRTGCLRAPVVAVQGEHVDVVGAGVVVLHLVPASSRARPGLAGTRPT